MASQISFSSSSQVIPHENPSQPFVKAEGRKKYYYYNEEDSHIDHQREASHIFFSTQKERFISLLGRVIESVAALFGFKIRCFSSYHYFSQDEQENDIYKIQSLPISLCSQFIGHATCLLQVEKNKETGMVTILTDPIAGGLNALFYPRQTRPAYKLKDFPLPDIILISHNHRDHCDIPTLKSLIRRKPDIVLIVPKGDREKLVKSLPQPTNIQEMDWWEEKHIPISGEKNITITAVPSRHWSGRGLCDSHQSLFCGYVIHQDSGDIYFAGDTALLSEQDQHTLRDRFNICTSFQPGGPDENRLDMKSTHQSSADGLLTHCTIVLGNLYQRMKKNNEPPSLSEFIETAKKTQTIYMHYKTFKLGNLHFNDTEKSVGKIIKKLQNLPNESDSLKVLDTSSKSLEKHEFSNGKILSSTQLADDLKPHELEVFSALKELLKEFKFRDGKILSSTQLADILSDTVTMPNIGAVTPFKEKIGLGRSSRMGGIEEEEEKICR